MNEKNIEIKNIIFFIKNRLKEKYPLEEINSFVNIIFEDLLGFSNVDIHVNYNKKLDENLILEIERITNELLQEKPIQYIIGNAYFYDLKFKVSSDVLIPRQETEELVDWIITTNKNRKPNILDIGTGSGCIAITLAKNIIDSKVSAFDISKKALKIAKENSIINEVNVDFSEYNIIEQSNCINYKYDIIVSNPPYICEKERKLMNENVLGNEPELALFVPNNDPLIFYRKILEFAKNNLSEKGKVFFEINEAYGIEMKNLMNEMDYDEIILKKDINSRDRMICGTLKAKI